MLKKKSFGGISKNKNPPERSKTELKANKKMAKISKAILKKRRTPSHFTNHLALLGFSKILVEIDKQKEREPMDGDETEAVGKELVRLLDENEGNA